MASLINNAAPVVLSDDASPTGNFEMLTEVAASLLMAVDDPPTPTPAPVPTRTARVAWNDAGNVTVHAETHYAPGFRRYPKHRVSKKEAPPIPRPVATSDASTPRRRAGLKPRWTHRAGASIKRRRRSACARAQRHAEERAAALREANAAFDERGDLAAGQHALFRALSRKTASAIAEEAAAEELADEQMSVRAQFDFLRAVHGDSFPLPDDLVMM